jgi:hypothetical protein
LKRRGFEEGKITEKKRTLDMILSRRKQRGRAQGLQI